MNSMSCNTSSIHFWVTWIEERYPPSVYSSWTRRHPLLPITAVLLYLFGISVGQKLMSTRKPFHLKQLLLLWNLSLAVFSIMTTIRLITGIGCTLRQMSLSERLCFTNVDSVSMFWGFLFVFSKFAEFGDTLFLILRKKDVIFLHSYHHVTVLLYTWFAYADEAALGHLFSLINLVVHSFMYTYYALQTMGFRFPRFIPMSLTALQISQMLAGMYLLTLWYQSARRGLPCGSGVIWITGLLMYASYFALFLHFFYKSYIRKSDRPVVKSPANGLSKKSE